MNKKIIDSNTKLYGLIGNPAGHSFSPFIHNFLFEYYKLNKIYMAFNVDPPLDAAINGIKGLDIKGFNVTSPYKEEIIKHIDWISRCARGLESVNTVKNINGGLYGFNTDFFGVVKSFETNNVNLKGKKALVFGGGAIARTVVNVLEYLKAENIVILNRTPEKARSIIKNIKKRRKFLNYEELNNENINNEVNNTDIIINATSIDVLSEKSYYIDWEKIREGTVFFDVLYNPETTLITQAGNKGFKVITGLDMLVWQALKSFQIWTGIYQEKDLKMYSILMEYVKNITK